MKSIKNSKLSTNALSLIQDDMCINAEHLVNRLESPDTVLHSDTIYSSIEEFSNIVRNKSPAETINKHFCKVSNSLNEVAYITLDSLRVTFFRYADGGLRDLYTFQENESWFPKVTLKKVLEPNDISTLETEFLIYRGCSRSEYESGKYGQSWTTKRQVAEEFAFSHYCSQEWLKSENRIVVCANFYRKDVLFSDQSECGEFEVAIRVEALQNIEIATYE